MGVYRVMETKGKFAPPVDEWTLFRQIREGKVQPQTAVCCEGRILPAEQVPALAPMFNQAKPLASYLQPSQAGFVSSNDVAPSTRLTGTQIIGILVGVGCLILLCLSLVKPSTSSSLQGQWNNVATAEAHSSR